MADLANSFFQHITGTSKDFAVDSCMSLGSLKLLEFYVPNALLHRQTSDRVVFFVQAKINDDCGPNLHLNWFSFVWL
jgi:hypothetical protein